MSQSIETPFPVKATVTATETGYRLDAPCESVWLTETEEGDFAQEAADTAERIYGTDTPVRFLFEARGFSEGCTSVTILGEADEDGVGEFEVRASDETVLDKTSDTHHARHGPLSVRDIRVSERRGKLVEFGMPASAEDLTITYTADELVEEWGEMIAADPFALQDGGDAQ